MYQVTTYDDQYLNDTIKLILDIQQNEFDIPVSLQTQPDLLKIPEVYQSRHGNFWIALHENKPIGTIGLIDMGNNTGVIRKMFVHALYRGNTHGVARSLLQTLLQWCEAKKITKIFLGTVDKLRAAHRFYEKNGFVRISIEELPDQFPLMKVDTIFYKYEFSKIN